MSARRTTRGPHLAPALEQLDILVPAAPSGVTVDRYVWGDIYTGTKMDLIAAGLARDGQFPGDPGNDPRNCKFNPDGTPHSKRQTRPAGGLAIQRARRRGVFELYRDVDKAVSNARLRCTGSDEAAKKAAAELAAARDAAKDAPKTAKEFSDRAAASFWLSWNIFCRGHLRESEGDGGFALSPGLKRWLSDTADEIHWQIMHSAHEERDDALFVEFSEERANRRLRQAQTAVARADAPLQAFLVEVQRLAVGDTGGDGGTR